MDRFSQKILIVSNIGMVQVWGIKDDLPHLENFPAAKHIPATQSYMHNQVRAVASHCHVALNFCDIL